MPRFAQLTVAVFAGTVWGLIAGDIVCRLGVLLTPHGYDPLVSWAGGAAGGVYCAAATLRGPRLWRDVPATILLVWVWEFAFGFLRYFAANDLAGFFGSVLPGVFRGALHWLWTDEAPVALLTLAGAYPVVLWIRRRAAEAEEETRAVLAARAARDDDGTWNLG